MPAVPAVLSSLIQASVASKLEAVTQTNPLSGKDPSYFIEFCTAIGTGIALGSPVIAFDTDDSGQAGVPPVPGAGSGAGIMVDDSFLTEKIYTYVRNNTLAMFGKTNNIPFPPTSLSDGKALLAVAEGIATGVKTHYSTAWILVSTHPAIYAGTGTIGEGDFSGVSDSLVKSQIVASGPRLQGPMFPEMAKAIAQAYMETIHQKSTGTVTITGVCVPGPSQVCGTPSTGSGTGTAT